MRSAQDSIKDQKGRFHEIWLKEVVGEKNKVSYFCSIACRLFK